MSRFVMPIEQVVNSAGSAAGAGWLLNFYDTGTTTRKDTFSDSALSSANANPVVADSAGRFGDIFLESGTYKVVLTDEASVEIWTADPVVGALGSSGAFLSNKTAAYTVTIDDATKVIPVDTATTGAVTITLPAVATATSGFEITIFKLNAGANDVTIDPDGSETIGGLANLLLTKRWESVTIRANDNPATDDWTIIARYDPPSKGTDIASATTTDIASADGAYVDITGTTTITAFGTAEIGAERIVQFDDALTLTHNATSLILPSAANITTAAGDRAKMFSLGSGNWICLWYTRADGTPVGSTNSGHVIQVVNTTKKTTQAITGNIPSDDTTPLISEGDLILTRAITPNANANALLVSVRVFVGTTTADAINVTLFQDSTLVAAVGGHVGAGAAQTLSFDFYVSGGIGTSSISFTVRCGATAQNIDLNGAAGGQWFNGGASSSITIQEIAA